MKPKRKKTYVYQPPIHKEWHPAQTRPHDWEVFKTLQQSNPDHVEKFGCRICGTITFNSAFIGTNSDNGFERQLCLYHSVTIVRLKKDWLPSGVSLRIKKMPSIFDRRDWWEQWKALAQANDTFGVNFY